MLNSLKKFVSGRMFIFLGSAFLVFMLVIVFRQFADRHGVQKEITDLQTQSKSLQQKNQDLQNLIAYLQTSDYKQRAARQQLNLKQDGEVVYNFSSQDPTQSGSAPGSNPDGSTAGTGQDISNPHKWWNYFFKPAQ